MGINPTPEALNTQHCVDTHCDPDPGTRLSKGRDTTMFNYSSPGLLQLSCTAQTTRSQYSMSTPDYTPPDGDATQVPKDVYEQIVARVKAECEAIGGVSERAYRRRLAKHIKRWKQIESSPHPSTIRGKEYYHSDPVFRVVSHDCRDNCVVCG